MKERNFIVMYFLKVIWKRNMRWKLVIIFLIEIKSYDLKDLLWNDFVSICIVIYINDKIRFENIFVKEKFIDNILIISRKKMFIFNDNYLGFCFLYVLVVCDNIIVVIFLI